MGRRFSTKPVTTDPAQAVRNYVRLIFAEDRPVGFKEVWVWEEVPNAEHLFYTRVTCTGMSRFARGQAIYEGPYGRWVIDLAPQQGFPRTVEKALQLPCTRVWGSAHLKEASDEWRETEEQRRERLRALFERDPDAVSRAYQDAVSWKQKQVKE